jgi:hypothetical protein
MAAGEPVALNRTLLEQWHANNTNNSLSEVSSLDLKGKRIETIHAGTLTGLVKLKELRLNENQLRAELDPRLFSSDLAGLERLYLRYTVTSEPFTWTHSET